MRIPRINELVMSSDRSLRVHRVGRLLAAFFLVVAVSILVQLGVLILVASLVAI
jgi:hypothetical protein